MFLRRFYHDGLAQASYLLGCEREGIALVVDPNRDNASYEHAAREAGLRIAFVTETHIHADFVSGSIELAARTGARLLLSGEGGRHWQYGFAVERGARLMRDGDTLMLGRVRIEALHTPGHTPEHLTFLITDTAGANRPMGAFTGDFLFVGDVGRPDLLERAAGIDGTMRASAAELFHSLRRFASQPDFLQIWPGHGAGSACGKSLGAVPQSTLGYERQFNWAFAIDDEATFIESVLEGQPTPPRYFAVMKQVNRDGPALLGTREALQRRDGGAVVSALARGALLLDVRRAEEFAKGHVPRSLNVPFKSSFVGWAGALLPYDRDLLLLTGSNDASHAEAVRAELSMVGLDRVLGYAGADVLHEWIAGGGELATVSQLSPVDVDRERQDDAVQIIDVRADGEWAQGHIPGAGHIPLAALPARLDELDRERPVVLQCQSGGRSSIATSLLLAHGFDAANLRGGISEWVRTGLPVEGEPDVALST